MGKCSSTVRPDQQWVDGTHAPETRKVLRWGVWITEPYPEPAAVEPCQCQVWIKFQRAVNEPRASIQILSHIGNGVTGPGQRDGVILAQRNGDPTKSRSFLDIPLPVNDP